MLGGNPWLASVGLLAWQAMRKSVSASHYFPPDLHNSFKFCFAKLAAVRQIKLFRRKSLCAPGFQVFAELVTERWLVSVAELSRSDRGMAKTRKSK